MAINSFAPLNPALLDFRLPEHDGYPADKAAGDTRDVLWDVCGAASRKFPKSFEVEPRHWAERARENDKYHTWGINYLDRFTNQPPTHECTAHSLQANGSGARNRHRGIIFKDGPVKDFRYAESATSGSVWFSCMYPYNIANPGIRGGAGVREVLEIVCDKGFLPEHTQPRDYGFKHTVPGTMGAGNNNQSKGKWVSEDDLPDGYEETAKHFKPLEIVFPESFEEFICMILGGVLMSVGRDGHAVPEAFLKFNENDELIGAGYSDSYNVIRYDSVRTLRSCWRGSFGIVTMTKPDSYDKPAG